MSPLLIPSCLPLFSYHTSPPPPSFPPHSSFIPSPLSSLLQCPSSLVFRPSSPPLPSSPGSGGREGGAPRPSSSYLPSLPHPLPSSSSPPFFNFYLPRPSSLVPHPSSIFPPPPSSLPPPPYFLPPSSFISSPLSSLLLRPSPPSPFPSSPSLPFLSFYPTPSLPLLRYL